MCVNLLLRLGSLPQDISLWLRKYFSNPNIQNTSDPKHLNESHSGCNLPHEGLGPMTKGPIPQSCHIGIRAAT